MQVKTQALLSELTWVNRFVERKTSIPILSNVLFHATKTKLHLTATDLEVSGTTSIADLAGGDWAVAVPVGKLIQYLGKIDEHEVTLSATDNHWLVVKHGTDITRISGMSRESFPELPEAPDTQLVLTGLPLAIQRVAIAMSVEESRFTLNGAALEIDEASARLVATDGHRLSLMPFQTNGTSKLQAVLPKKALLEAGRMNGECEFSTNEDFAFFSYGQRRIATRKLAGKFPDYHRVIKDDFPHHVHLPTKTTLKTLERVALCADERGHCVKLTIADDKLTIFASSVDLGEAEGTVPVQPGEYGALEIGLNATFISDFLSRVDTPFVSYCYTDGKQVSAFTTEDLWAYYCMPMRA